MNAEIKVAAVADGAGQVNAVTFRVGEIAEKGEFPGANGGTLTFMKKELVATPTMVDYLRAGWTISMTAAIDYTASNGAMTNP